MFVCGPALFNRPPAAGTLLSQYCSGTTLVGRYADGYGGTYDQTIATNSATCGYVAPYAWTASSGVTLSESNRLAMYSAPAYPTFVHTLVSAPKSSGKLYLEVEIVTASDAYPRASIGVAQSSVSVANQTESGGVSSRMTDGVRKYSYTGGTNTVDLPLNNNATVTNASRLGIAVDFSAGSMHLYQGGTLVETLFTDLAGLGALVPYVIASTQRGFRLKTDFPNGIPAGYSQWPAA